MSSLQFKYNELFCVLFPFFITINDRFIVIETRAYYYAFPQNCSILMCISFITWKSRNRFFLNRKIGDIALLLNNIFFLFFFLRVFCQSTQGNEIHSKLGQKGYTSNKDNEFLLIICWMSLLCLFLGRFMLEGKWRSCLEEVSRELILACRELESR
jgi:hypothetical protein